MKLFCCIGGKMFTLVITGIYGFVSGMLGVFALQHWYWWPGLILALVIGVVVDEWSERE